MGVRIHEWQSTSISGNIETTPHVICRLMYEPSNYHGANNKNYVRANDHNDRANNACALLRLHRLLRQQLRLGGHLWHLRQLRRPKQVARVHPPAVPS